MDRILARGQIFLLALAAVYAVFIGLLTVPYFQRHAVFMHAVRWPLFAELNNPVKYGLPASRTVNIQIETSDKVKLGAWLVLPPSQPEITPFGGFPSMENISRSLENRPTVLFLHGNAATRAVPFRVQHCSTYASRFGANVLAIDYRGYGDSEGTPSEEGLITDGHAAWNWAVQHGAKAEDILLVGLSIGTGVVSGLGAELAKNGAQPRGIVLLAPFTSIPSLLTEYQVFGLFPVLQPLQMFPRLQKFIASFFLTQFNTTQALPAIKAPILLAHAKDDFDIPCSHSQFLFDGLVEQFLPSKPPLPASPIEIQRFDWASVRAVQEERRLSRSALVNKQEIPGFATVHRLSRPNDFGDVVFVEASYGGHDRIGLQDSLVDVIDSVFF